MSGVTRITRVTSMTRGLDHGFCQKFEIFPSFYFWQSQPAKCVREYSRKKKSVYLLYIKKVKQSKNRDFSKGVSPWVW